MQKKVVASVVLTLALIGILIVWLGRGKHETVAEVPAAASENAGNVDIQTAAKQSGVSTDQQSNEVVGVSTPTPSNEAAVQKVAPKLSAGTYRKIPSLELRTYYMLTGAGGNPAFVSQQLGLNDREATQLLDYAGMAVKSDKINQRRLREDICSSRTTYQTLEQFGIALNDFGTEAETHQESLGRGIQAGLDPSLYGKIKSFMAREAPREQVSADFPRLLVEQHRDLKTEIDRFCRVRNDIDNQD